MGWAGLGALGTSREFPGEPLRTPGSSRGVQLLSTSALLHRPEQAATFSIPHTPVENKKLVDGHASKFTRVDFWESILITLDELEDGKFNLFRIFTKSLPKYTEKVGDQSPQKQTVSWRQDAQAGTRGPMFL